MNLHAEKTEVLLEMCEKHGIELSAKPTRNEMLKKLSEANLPAEESAVDPLLGKGPEEPVKQAPAKQKQVKKGAQPYQEYKLREVARGSKRAAEGLQVDISLPYSYDDEGYPVKFSHCVFDTKVKVTKITQAQADVLNSHAHSAKRYFKALED